jgi:hypothetical protein
MKWVLGSLAVAAIVYVITRIVARPRPVRMESEEPASWPLGDPRMRGFAGAFRMN